MDTGQAKHPPPKEVAIIFRWPAGFAAVYGYSCHEQISRPSRIELFGHSAAAAAVGIRTQTGFMRLVRAGLVAQVRRLQLVAESKESEVANIRHRTPVVDRFTGASLSLLECVWGATQPQSPPEQTQNLSGHTTSTLLRRSGKQEDAAKHM